jgi:rhodanese-related sulfurtransferase
MVLLAVLPLSLGCGQDPEERPDPGAATATPEAVEAASYEDITVEELRAMMADGDIYLVNVHVPFEGDIPGTDQSIRFDEITDHLDQLPQDREAEIVLYCRSGRMSEEAAANLAALGYTNVSNLEGGFRAWEAAGFEIIR